MMSALTIVFNTDILCTVIRLYISDGQIVKPRYRSVDGESILDTVVHAAVEVDVAIT